MSELLNKNPHKKSNLLKSSNAPKPDQAFDKKNLSNDISKFNMPRVKTTTIRCNQETANLIKAITTVGDAKSVDSTLNNLLDEYMPKLTDNEINQIKTVKKIYDAQSGITN